MPGAQPRRGFEARVASTARRGAYSPPGVPGVYRLPRRQVSPITQDRGSPGRVPSLDPIYWYDAADASTSSWPSHESHGNTLSTVSGSGTIVSNALNGQPGVQVSGGFMRYQGSQETHAFSDGIAVLVVAVEASTDSAFVNLFNFGGDPTQYQFEETSGTIHAIYTDPLNQTITEVYSHTRVTGDPVAVEMGVDASGDPSLRVNGTDLSPTSSSGSAGATTEVVDFMQIGLFSTLTYCEVMVYDATDTAGISAARSFLSSKYAISV